MSERRARPTAAYSEALQTLPEHYHKYVSDIKGKPYLQVDGRIAMAVDEHLAVAGTLDISTIFLDVVGNEIMCRAQVESSIRGRATGHAKAFIGGKGVDETNPYENAETSAVGRALGFLGYGLFGSGIASAEEVETAKTEQQRSKTPETANKADVAEPQYASKEQVNTLLEMAERHGLTQRLDEYFVNKELDILHLPVSEYRAAIGKMQAVIHEDTAKPDLEAFHKQARTEAEEAWEAQKDAAYRQFDKEEEPELDLGEHRNVPEMPEKAQEPY